MKRCLLWGLFWLLSAVCALAQQSPNTVKYKVTYEATTQTYTAWVVPDYATPNTNNGGASELVSTAQFTLKVPIGFVISTITDATFSQVWDKYPAKLGPGLSLTAVNGTVFTQDYSPAVLDPAYAYYVIGKAPTESNLGAFVAGVPVALFSFKGNGCFGPISPLPAGDPFIQAAVDAFSFNVGNSFYSFSGQPAGGNQDPLEQFINITGSVASCSLTPVQPIVTPDIANTNINTPVTGNVLTNDADPQGGPLTASLITPPASGTVTLTPTGSYTYTPPTGFTGTVSFCYSASNTAGLSASTCVTINVNPDPSPTANDRPIANNDATQTTQGVPVIVAVLANDTDPDSATSTDGQLNNPTLISQPSVGTAVVNANGTVTFTPPANFTGVVTFPYQVCDKATTPLCATALVTVNVQPTPPANTTLAPVAVDDALLTQVNTPKTGNVSTNDSDPNLPALPLTYTTGQPSSGTVVMSPAGSYTYTPAPGFVGPTSFTYTVCNSAGKCDVATVSVDVQKPAGGVPPVVIGEPLVTDKGKPAVLCLPIIDPDAGDSHTATICGQPVSGTATLSVNNITHTVCLTYTPTTTFDGPTTVCVQVCDATGLCTNVIIPVTVIPTSPTAVTPMPPLVVVEPIVTPKDVPVTVCMDIKDPNLTDTHSVSVCSSPTKGSVTATVNNTTHEVCLTYKPTSGSVGPDAICLTVCDQGGLCTTVTVPVIVVEPTIPGSTPKPPVVTPTPIVTTVDKPVVVCTAISDPNIADTHTATICGQPVNGSVQLGVDNANHRLCVTYTPGSTPVSTSVCIQVCDQGGLCTTVILPITVLPVSKAPIVTPDIDNTNINTPVSGNVLTNDVDPQGSPLTAGMVGPLNGPGTLAFGTDGSYTYTPPANFTGTVSFCYSASNTFGISASTCVTINVNPDPSPIANNRPIANNDATQTTQGVPVIVTVLANDTDPDSNTSGNGQLNNPTLISQPSVGTAVVNANGTVTYTPPANFTGVVTFSYQVCDKASSPLCATALVTVNVQPTPPVGTTLAPVAVDDALLVMKDKPSTGNVSTNDSDPQGLPLTYATGQPTNGMVVMSPTGSYTYTPAPGFVGPDSFTYTVCNSAGKCDVATVSVDVQQPAIVEGLKLRLKVMLQGALIGGSTGLMRDDLRSKGFLPLTEPYSAIGGSRFTQVNGGGGETMPASVTLANAGTGDAIVDWVFVELRSPSNLSVVVATHSALVQRDGDVVLARDGVTPLTFTSLTAGSYYVSVKHRNHLGAMTATAIPLSTTGTVVDFTTMTSTQLWNTTIGAFNYNGWEQTTVNGKQALWAGDANHDGKVKYQGTLNDLIPIFSEVIGAQGSIVSPVYNYDNAFGYYFGDVNMDGKVKYQGTSNDTSLIFTNVLTNYQTLNSGQLYNFDFMLEQIP